VSESRARPEREVWAGAAMCRRRHASVAALATSLPSSVRRRRGCVAPRGVRCGLMAVKARIYRDCTC
jgi:hypothetical protein